MKGSRSSHEFVESAEVAEATEYVRTDRVVESLGRRALRKANTITRHPLIVAGFVITGTLFSANHINDTIVAPLRADLHSTGGKIDALTTAVNSNGQDVGNKLGSLDSTAKSILPTSTTQPAEASASLPGAEEHKVPNEQVAAGPSSTSSTSTTTVVEHP